MSKFTPGPWVAVARTNAYIDIEAPNEHGYVAKKVASLSMPNHTANASLIAAAPELLQSLKEVVDWLEIGDHESAMHTKARLAIAKATGEKV